MAGIQPKKGNTKLNASIKETTLQTLQEKAGGPRKVGALIDQIVEKYLTGEGKR